VKYLVDTDWLADWLMGKPSAVDLLTRLGEDGLSISIITYGEIYEGIYYGYNPSIAEAGFRRFLRNVSVLALNRPIMRRFAQIRGDLRRRGQIIGDPDILIAATAVHHDLTIVTRNRTHFERIPDVNLHQASSTGV
jgi:tRNA(fMet)-specific endonuclease VapC